MTKQTPDGTLARPLRTTAWSCRAEDLPAGSALDLISDRPNRWNAQGEPTIYLSGDPALALVESGRHLDDLEERSRLIEVDLRVPLAVDLRDPAARAALELPRDLGWVFDRDRTRGISQSLRHSGMCDAIIVPSAGALDQPERWNAVVFADHLANVIRMVRGLRPGGHLVVSERRG